MCAISYGAYRYAPVGPSEVRMALAVVFGLFGVAMVVGKIGGRRLPLVAADLLKYRLGARVYAGQVSQLVRAEPPAPAQPVRSGPGPLSLMAKRAGRGLGRLRKRRKTRKNKERRNGRMRWFGKRRGKDAGNQQARDHRAATLETSRRKPRRGFLAFAALAVLALALVTVPQVALANDHEPWRDEIDFEVEEPVEGRRIFVERLTVSGDRAAVTFRAATALDIRVRAYGGPEGTWLRFGVRPPWRRGSASTTRSPSTDRRRPSPSRGRTRWGRRSPHGRTRPDPVPAPRSRGRALRPSHDLPELDARSGQRGHRVGVRVRRRGAHRTSDGGRAPERQPNGAHGRPGDGHHGDRRRRDRRVAYRRRLRPNGETSFQLGVPAGAAIHAVTLDVSLEASLSIPIPPLTQLTHHPERVEQVTRTVHLHRPGDSDYDSQTVTVTNEDGATESATATAYAYVPSATIAKQVTVDVLHKEHVKAEVVERSPITRSRDEALSLASGVGSDDPYEGPGAAGA